MSAPRKILISIFILFNFVAMLRTHLPMQSKFVSTLYRPVDKYLAYFSIFQDWMMFSPNPSREDIYISARVEFQDGSFDTYDFEHSSMGNLLDKYVYAERFRKISAEAIRKDQNRFMWKDTAFFALRKVRNKNLGKLPVKVELHRHWAPTPDMFTNFQPHGKKKTNYLSYNFYTQEVM